MTTRTKYWIEHDTIIVLDCSDQALLLFRCVRDWLIGRDMLDLISIPEMRELAKLRLAHIREVGELHAQDLPLRRPDGSMFWVISTTTRLETGRFLSELVYRGDYNPHYHGT